MLDDGLRIQLDLQLVLLGGLRIGLRVLATAGRKAVGDLCEVDLVEPVLVAEAVLDAVGRSLLGRDLTMLDLFRRPVPIPLDIDADAAVERQVREVDVHISHARLDDLSQHRSRLLVVRYARLDRAALH